MEEFIRLSIKYFFEFFTAIFVCFKLTNKPLKKFDLVNIPIAIIIAIGLYFLGAILRGITPIVMLLLMSLYVLIRFRFNYVLCLQISTIALGFSYITDIFGMLIAFPLSLPIYIFRDILPSSILLAILIGACEFSTVFIIFKIKRFKSGIKGLENSKVFNLLLFFSFAIIIAMSLFYNRSDTSAYLNLAVLFLTILGLGLIITFRKNITSNYKSQLIKRNNLIFEENIEKLNTEKEELLLHNENMAKIIHRDNKLLKAMKISVENLLETYQNDENAKELLNTLTILSNERETEVNTYKALTDTLPKTNIITIDAVISFLNTKAEKVNCMYNVSVSEDFTETIKNTQIDLTDLNTIICDLGENATISTQTSDIKNILIEFGVENSFPFVTIFDSGNEFDENVLYNIGRKKITTHKEDGGSGIGLVNTFELLLKYDASFTLNELTKKENLTKAITITFDNKSLFNILSNREKLIELAKKRKTIYD